MRKNLKNGKSKNQEDIFFWPETKRKLQNPEFFSGNQGDLAVMQMNASFGKLKF